MNAPDLSPTLDPGRILPLGDRTVNPVRELTSPYGNRLTPFSMLEATLGRRRSILESAIILDPPSRQGEGLVVHCPVTAVPMTEKMADMVHLDRDDLQAMVDREVPLGLTANQWEIARGTLFDALIDSGFHDDGLIVKAGGSAVSGFSSLATAVHKKNFPQTLDALIDKVVANGQRHQHFRERVELDLTDARREWSRLSVGERPRAPWYGIMHHLNLEPEPDVDIQIYSPTLDRLITEHPELKMYSKAMIDKDRWGRWQNSAVWEVAAPLRAVRTVLGRQGIRVDLEFLAGSAGRDRITARDDWWTVDVPHY